MWCGLIKLAYSPGAMVASFSFVSSHLCKWAVIFVCGRSFLFVGGLPCTWAVVFVQVHSSCMCVVVCIWGRVAVVMGMDVDTLQLLRVVVVVVVMGCGWPVTVVDVLWALWMWLWLWLGVVSSSLSIDRLWVARGHVVFTMLSSSSIDGL